MRLQSNGEQDGDRRRSFPALAELRRRLSSLDACDSRLAETPERMLCLDVMRIYVRSGKLPVVLTGANGAGKTALLDQLVARADARWHVVRIPAASSYTTFELARLLGDELGLERCTSATRVLVKLDECLERGAFRGRTIVLVVDDAERLHNEVLAWLHALPTRLSRRRMRVVFGAEPGFDRRLAAVVNPDRSVKSAHVLRVPARAAGAALWRRALLGLVSRARGVAMTAALVVTVAALAPGSFHPSQLEAREIAAPAMTARPAQPRARGAKLSRGPVSPCREIAGSPRACKRDPGAALELLLFSHALLPRVWTNGR